MFYVVSGGSGSGKSEYAEQLALTQETFPRIYIATMIAVDDEAGQKVARHRRRRKGMGFETIECPVGLKHLHLPEKATVLLDCMSNLAANEMFSKDGAGAQAAEAILKGVRKLVRPDRKVIIVTNEIFSDGCVYGEGTMEYIQQLGRINQGMAQMADVVTEVVCGIPVHIKEEGKLCGHL